MRIEVEELKYGYTPSRLVLNGISLSWSSETPLCILGTNGTGKSTLLQCLAGQFRPLSGHILIGGKPIEHFRPRHLAAKMAYLPQTHTPVFPFRSLDVVVMGRTARRGPLSTPGKLDEDAARDCLASLGVGHLAERPYTSISGGERQLVLLASAIAQRPEVLLLDEPTSHLDFGNSHIFVELLRGLTAKGMGVIMTTHFPDQALALGGQVTVLSGGRVSATGQARDVLTDSTLSTLYSIDVHVARFGDRAVCIPGAKHG